MIERITKNEDRFDKILESVKELELALYNFKNIKKDLSQLTRYYESKNWIKDKEALENNKIPRVKAGVLSEDGVWNMLSDIDSIISDMKKIIKSQEKNN